MKKIALLAACAALAATPAFADLASELSKAQTHAGLAAKASELKMVQMHLHHAVNCLVGPSGQGFDATNANPCAKDGNGALADASGDQKAKIQAAVADATPGLTTTDLATAQKAAQATADAIGNAK